MIYYVSYALLQASTGNMYSYNLLTHNSTHCEGINVDIRGILMFWKSHIKH